jgi:hypothetical protein
MTVPANFSPSIARDERTMQALKSVIGLTGDSFVADAKVRQHYKRSVDLDRAIANAERSLRGDAPETATTDSNPYQTRSPSKWVFLQLIYTAFYRAVLASERSHLEERVVALKGTRAEYESASTAIEDDISSIQAILQGDRDRARYALSKSPMWTCL